MKFLAFLAMGLVSVSAVSSLHAGGIGGPFNSYSPLQSGIDGVYQATARGKNLTGIITFTYSGGIPTVGGSANSWIFFVEGQIVRGQTSAAIDENKVAGVLDAGVVEGQMDSNGEITLPLILLNTGTASAGYFDGSIDLKSVNARFSGEGLITPSPGTTNQIIAISQPEATLSNGIAVGAINITNVTYTNIGGTIPPTPFKFSGYRLTTLAPGANTTNATNAQDSFVAPQ